MDNSNYISNLKSNIKSPKGFKWEINLGSKTLIVGPSGSGKSSIVESLSLCCWGRVYNQESGDFYATVKPLLAPGTSLAIEAEGNWEHENLTVNLWRRGSRVKYLAQFLPATSPERCRVLELEKEYKAEKNKIIEEPSNASIVTAADVNEAFNAYIKSRTDHLPPPTAHVVALKNTIIAQDRYETWVKARENNKKIKFRLKQLSDQLSEARVLLANSISEWLGQTLIEIQEYMPVGLTIGYASNKTDIILGLNRDGFIHEKVSGAEKAAIEAAFQCWMSDQRSESPFSLILFPDRSWDDGSLYKQMEALSGSQPQIVITSSRLPGKGVPPGWVVINLPDDRVFLPLGDPEDVT